jgi:hypothetical protein
MSALLGDWEQINEAELYKVRFFDVHALCYVVRLQRFRSSLQMSLCRIKGHPWDKDNT